MQSQVIDFYGIHKFIYVLFIAADTSCLDSKFLVHNFIQWRIDFTNAKSQSSAEELRNQRKHKSNRGPLSYCVYFQWAELR